MEVVGKQMDTVVSLLLRRVREKVSGEVLNKISGALYNSLVTSVTIDENRVIGRVFSDGSVPYFDIQERGGQTPPHDIVMQSAKALRFIIANGGREGNLNDTVFATIVHHPGSKIPAHWFMRDSLRESIALIREIFATDERKL